MAKGSSKGQEACYARYKTERRWESNRLKKLERALKRNPGNAEQIQAAMKAVVYRRKTPTTKVWSSTKRQTAILFKKFAKGSDFVIQSANWATMGLLSTRAHDSNGSLVWSS